MSCSANLGTGQSPGVINTASDPIWKIFNASQDIITGPAVLIGNPVWGPAPGGLHWIATQPGLNSGGNQYPGGEYIYEAVFNGDQGVLRFSVKADNAVRVFLNGAFLMSWGDDTGVSHSGWTTFSPVQNVTTGFQAVNTLDLRVHNNVGPASVTTYTGVLLQGQFDRSSGNPALIQSTLGTKGNFEVVVPYPSGGIAHFYRDNDQATLPWIGPTAVFGLPVTVDAVSLIQSSFNNLEVVARIGNELFHFYRDSASGNWNGPYFVAFGVSGTPSLTQDTTGNFEVITPLAGGGMARCYRDSSVPFSWHGPTIVSTTAVEAVSLIQSSYGGNLEVIARIGNDLFHFYRDFSSGIWGGPFFITSGVSGAPSLIQSRAGTPGNFEVVTPLAAGGMAHFWRDNSNSVLPWSGPNLFGSGSVDGAALIQSSYGNNLEVVAIVGCNGLSHYYRDNLNIWSGPFVIVP